MQFVTEVVKGKLAHNVGQFLRDRNILLLCRKKDICGHFQSVFAVGKQVRILRFDGMFPEVQIDFNAALRYVRKTVALAAVGKSQRVQPVEVCVCVSPRNAAYKQKEYTQYEQDQDELFLPRYAAASRFRLAAA